ncbi:hypothetical protein BSCH_02406 [Candidatus Paraburkholderia schumanniana]|nr:hypothetical protein BSCH_02406 [Candidatus Paraburkholderia schumannianae]
MEIFAALEYTEERQVLFAVFQFDGPARAWWNMVQAKWEREVIPRTWENFVREFNSKFIPPIVQERRVEAFIRCRQGVQSVADYETQFTKLSRYAPVFVGTDQMRIQRFIQGLNVELQESLAAVPATTYGEAVERALRVESAKALVNNFQAKRKVPAGFGQGMMESAPPPKFGRGMGGPSGFRPPRGGVARGSGFRGAPSGGTPSGRGQGRSEVPGSSSGQACDFCGKLR